jgi:hypothetical protein
MTSGRVATTQIGGPVNNQPQACAIGVLVDHRIPNPATRGKLVYPMSGNFMFFEKINEDDCLFLYGA